MKNLYTMTTPVAVKPQTMLDKNGADVFRSLGKKNTRTVAAKETPIVEVIEEVVVEPVKVPAEPEVTEEVVVVEEEVIEAPKKSKKPRAPKKVQEEDK